jgi:hypothetical protein
MKSIAVPIYTILGVVTLVAVVWLPVGLKMSALPSSIVEVETRNIPIVRVVIEGPGGDLVPVEYARLDKTVLVTESPGHFAWWVAIVFAWVSLLTWPGSVAIWKRRTV